MQSYSKLQNHRQSDTDDIKSVSNAMFDQRRKHFSKLPKSLDNALQQLRILETDKYFMFIKSTIYLCSGRCLTTVQNINFLVQFCSELFCDGTFGYSPKYFLQLYTIHSYKNGFYFPLVYFFLKTKLKILT